MYVHSASFFMAPLSAHVTIAIRRFVETAHEATKHEEAATASHEMVMVELGIVFPTSGARVNTGESIVALPAQRLYLPLFVRLYLSSYW